MNYRNLTDMAEIQLLKQISIKRREQVRDLQSRIRFIEELIAEVGMLNQDDVLGDDLRREMIDELIDWIIEILDNGFENIEYPSHEESLGFEEEDIFKYRS